MSSTSLDCSSRDGFGDFDSFCWMKNSLKDKWSVGVARLEGGGVPSDVDASSEGKGPSWETSLGGFVTFCFSLGAQVVVG